jgi:mRNA degradation ribonuclease J1/J2
MSIRFLLFRGNWENEGNFALLETEKNILILATGRDCSVMGLQEQQIGRDYLKENRAKIGGIVVTNTGWQNIGLLADICQEFGPHVPVYTSFYSKLVFSYLFPQLRNKVIVAEKNKEWRVSEFILSFSPLNSYLLGNLGLAVHYSQYSFYFLEGFVFSNLLENKVLFPNNFLPNFQQFCLQKRKITYLITSYWGLHWQNKNSLFFATKNFSNQDKSLFFIFYDFDWLHIFELLELARSWGKRVQVLDKDFALLVSQVLAKSPLQTVIEKEQEQVRKFPSQQRLKKDDSKIYLLTGNPENIEKKISDCLITFPLEKKSNFQFVVGVPPVIGGESRLARIIDYLYTQSEEIVNLSKKEYLSLGVSFYDFKLLLQLLQPVGIITLQNSYKNKNFSPHLPGKFLTLKNGCALDFPTRKISSLKAKKTLITLDELLVEQRSNLGRGGLLIVLLAADWKDDKLQLREVRIDPVAISSVLNIPKLTIKIKNWWPTKLVPDIKRDDNIKIIKKIVERRLNGLAGNYLRSEHDINLEEALILLFLS